MTHYHFIGIGGAGMSSLARYTLEQGHRVTGSDLRDGPTAHALRARGAEVFIGHDRDHVAAPDVVVASGAIPDTNVEVQATRARGLQVLHRGELLARFTHEHPESIVVCGTHGKGTTAGALVTILEAAGRSVSYVLGAPRKLTGRAAHFDPRADALVVEVDESDGSHLHHHPRHLLLCNLELDHLYTYPTLDHLVDAFAQLLCQQLRHEAGAACVVGRYGAGVPPLLARLREHGVPHLTCGEQGEGELHARALALDPEDGSLRFELHRGEQRLATLHSPLRGRLNARNVLAAAAFALAIDVPLEAIDRGVRRFDGLADRFDERRAGGRLVITDYTSHPTSIAGNLDALTERTPGRLHAVFQPFRVSLFGHYFEAYAEALSAAHHVHLIPMDRAGEPPRAGVDSGALQRALRERGVRALLHPDRDALEEHLRGAVGAGDTLIIFGGGPLFALARRLADLWSA